MALSSYPENFDGKIPKIDPGNAAMLLIDHQSGLFKTVGDMPMPELRLRAGALAHMATLARLPVITTASVPQGPNGPLIPQIHANAPHAKYAARRGEINAWDNPDFIAAVKATGKRQPIIAGTITSVCMAFPSVAAVHDGYQLFAVVDASGTYSKMAQEISSPVLCRPAWCRWIRRLLHPNCKRLGIARMRWSGPRSTRKSSRPISS